MFALLVIIILSEESSIPYIILPHGHLVMNDKLIENLSFSIRNHISCYLILFIIISCIAI